MDGQTRYALSLVAQILESIADVETNGYVIRRGQGFVNVPSGDVQYDAISGWEDACSDLAHCNEDSASEFISDHLTDDGEFADDVSPSVLTSRIRASLASIAGDDSPA